MTLSRPRSAFAVTLLLAFAASAAFAQGDAKRGEYLAKAGGCVGCHTEDKKDAVPFAGGRALKTPFGTFYGPNITPDPRRDSGAGPRPTSCAPCAQGERPDGKQLLPGVSLSVLYQDQRRATCATCGPTCARCRRARSRASQHDLRLPVRLALPVTFWKWFFFTPGPYQSVATLGEIVNRGAYLVQALGHCGECHTPRNFLGGPKTSRFLAGGKGPEGKDASPTSPRPG